ncbi:MAG: response regulator transcription factor [Clostridia bacterium]|nr:response regulator transcription factor [Clostridia bacterium]
MLEIAILDDEEENLRVLEGYIARYCESEKIEYRVQFYKEALSFVEKYKAIYDIIFMDVEMPLMDGFSAARKIRKIDGETVLIFVTKMAQYAVKGYEVSAMDYVVKPVSYAQFYIKFKRAVASAVAKKSVDYYIKRQNCIVKLNVRDIRYIETSGRVCTFHTVNGDYETYATLYNVKEDLKRYSFLQCNAYTLVNPSYITGAKGLSILMNDTEIAVSRPRKKDFFRELNEWIGRVKP